MMLRMKVGVCNAGCGPQSAALLALGPYLHTDGRLSFRLASILIVLLCKILTCTTCIPAAVLPR